MSNVLIKGPILASAESPDSRFSTLCKKMPNVILKGRHNWFLFMGGKFVQHRVHNLRNSQFSVTNLKKAALLVLFVLLKENWALKTIIINDKMSGFTGAQVVNSSKKDGGLQDVNILTYTTVEIFVDQ